MPTGRVGGAGLTRNGPTARGLRPEDLRWRCDPVALGFETTENVRPLDAFVGQERGVSAIDLAVRVTAPDYNLFVAGAPGTGRTSITLDLLRRAAMARQLWERCTRTPKWSR